MTEYKNFHIGEQQLQSSAGVDTAEFNRRADEAFRPAMNDNEIKFVGARSFSVAASIDETGRPWVSPLVGLAGELLAVKNRTTVKIRPRPISGDPLLPNVRATGEMGLLYFDPSRRRRAKSLGRGTAAPDGSIEYQMHRNFGLCPKYIFKRSHDAATKTPQPLETEPLVSQQLSAEDRTQLEAADTVFVGSRSEQYGADATHRGGPPGFVTVVDETTVTIPDYMGNGMFQTLGNLLLDNHIGMLSIDFRTGRTLQLTGHGSIQQSDADDIYSHRTLAISIDEVRSGSADIGLWTDIEAFDLRPNLRNPATPFLKK